MSEDISKESALLVTKNMRQSEENKRFFLETGNLFNIDKYHFDGIAVWFPYRSFLMACGGSYLRTEFSRIVHENPENLVIISNMPLGQHYCNAPLYHLSSIHSMVFTALNSLIQHGATNIGLNGIKTYEPILLAEKEIYRACLEWLDTPLGLKCDSLTLIDLHGCFEFDRHTDREFKILAQYENGVIHQYHPCY